MSKNGVGERQKKRMRIDVAGVGVGDKLYGLHEMEQKKEKRNIINLRLNLW